jgi:hypothetical protein
MRRMDGAIFQGRLIHVLPENGHGTEVEAEDDLDGKRPVGSRSSAPRSGKWTWGRMVDRPHVRQGR